MVDITALRNLYTPRIFDQYEQFWGAKLPRWEDEVDAGFEWMVNETLLKIFKTPVEEHWHYDFGKCVYQNFPDFHQDLVLALYNAGVLLKEDHGDIRHIKVMCIGNLMILAVLPEHPAHQRRA